MKFCPVVPDICRGHVHVPKKERKIIIIWRRNGDKNLPHDLPPTKKFSRHIGLQSIGYFRQSSRCFVSIFIEFL